VPELAQALERLVALQQENPAAYVWARGPFYDVAARRTEAGEVGFIVCPPSKPTMNRHRHAVHTTRPSSSSSPGTEVVPAKEESATPWSLCESQRKRQSALPLQQLRGVDGDGADSFQARPPLSPFRLGSLAREGFSDHSGARSRPRGDLAHGDGLVSPCRRVIARGNTVRAGSSWHAWQMETSREDGEVILTDTVTGERTVLWIMPTRARATQETTDWTPFKLALEMVFGRGPDSRRSAPCRHGDSSADAWPPKAKWSKLVRGLT
jgi:hypothetical protein